MKKKSVVKILALLVSGVSIFSFAGCGSCDDKGNGGHNPVYSWTENEDGTTHNGTCTVDGCDGKHNVTNEKHVYDGDDDATCNKCNHIRDVDGPVIGHEPEYEWTDNKDGTHSGTCKVDGCEIHTVTNEAHDFTNGDECPKCHGFKPNDVTGHTHSYTKWAVDTDDETKHVRTCSVDGCDKPVEREDHVYTDDEDATCNKCDYKRDIKKPEPPVIVNKDLEGAVEIIATSQSELEEAYVTWKIDKNAKWYNVYIKASGSANYTKLDAPLVRKYSDYFRADAVGLAKGTYDFKVVPVLTDGTEADEKYAAEATKINVKSHQRYGYAFIDGNVPGAYNMDGTLKANAQVIYVTAANAKTVKATVNGAEVTGFQSILDARQKGGEQPPISIRIVGTVTKDDLDHISSSAEGLQIKGKSKSAPAENITIEGIGSDGTIKDFGMLMRNCSNDEVRNLGILNCMDDGISIDTDNSHLWIHNNDIFYGKGGSGDKAKGDGALDTKNSTLVTHSYNHFWDCGKCNLQGMTSEDSDTRITYHHNWYDHSDSRHPRIRTATVHVFNNYFDGNAKYGVGVTMGASAFVENNYFRSTAMMRPMMSSLQGTDIDKSYDSKNTGTFSGENGGVIKAFGNTYDSPNTRLVPYSAANSVEFDCYEASSRDEKVPASVKAKVGGTSYNNFDTASDFYKYEVESAEDAKETVQRYAGRVDGGDLKWEFDNATEDGNYDIIPGLRAAVTDYKSSVLAIGEGATGTVVGGGDNGNGGDNNQGGDNGNGDNNDTVTGGITSNFVGGKPSNSLISVANGNEKKKVNVTIHAINQTFTSGLKLQKTTSITFTTTEKMTLTLYFDGSAGTTVFIDGNENATKSVGGDNVITIVLEAGAHEINKGSAEIDLYYLALVPVS